MSIPRVALLLGAFLAAWPRPARSASEQEAAGMYLEAERLADSSGLRLRALDPGRRRLLHNAASRHPVARLERVPEYDPEGVIGFCFGRAMAAYLLARRMGLPAERMRKLFVVGDLRSGDVPQWRFHVTLLAFGSDGEWHAMDPIMPGPMTAREWIGEVGSVWDKAGRARYYIAPASAVMPDLRDVPEPGAETGERVIELSFDPAGKPGFRPRPELGPSAFEAAPSASVAYFADALEGEARFLFLGLAINGRPYDYRGYFVDLLQDILGPVRGPGLRALAAPEAGEPDRSEPPPRVRPLELYSPRLDRLLGR